MRKITQAAVMGLAFVLTLAGCETATESGNAHLGTYHLVTLNGQTLPVHLGRVEETTLDVLGGHIALNADGTAISSLTILVTEAGVESEETNTGAGTFTRRGSSIIINWLDGGQDHLSWSGNELMLAGDGLVAVFRR
jgi:hypothetical protein